MKTIKTDCLIIGSGIAGSLYSYIAAKAGVQCILLSSFDISDGNSDLAQGGIIYESKPDYKKLLSDIQTAGCNI
ncbi:MAG: FAD-binding protein, partial [Endomicrobium sp.]|nr:FAD-binding protein [Endomicrobium sp.]